MRRSSPTILRSPLPPVSSLSGYSTALWLLCALFALRVAGQAIQYWAPHPALPPFEAFQGSGLPYALLLSVQVVILTWMGHLARQVSTGRMHPRLRTGRVLAWVGRLYFACMLARLAIGLAFDTGSAWFEAWIPAAFHLALAAFVLTLSAYHQRMSAVRFGRAT